MKKVALFAVLVVGLLGSGCGGTPEDVSAAQSALVPPAGTFCTQAANGSCVSAGNPIALSSWLCDDGTGPHVFSMMTAFQQVNTGPSTYVEHMLPKNSALDAWHLYLDATGGFPGQYPSRDIATWNFGTYLNTAGSNPAYLTRYVGGHMQTMGGFIEMTAYPGNGTTNGRWSGIFISVNHNTSPAMGLCSSSIPFDITL